ncbi:hypothetical protein ISS96_02485 [Candidatus Bathyarchaeota archaeon]|nr:hypothetical protein [Candidatus Bathyarchaeota archaeon]
MSSLHKPISTGSKCLDKILGGGFPLGCLSLIFGESGTGKTTLVMQCAVNYVKDGHSAIYVDSNREFSLDRLSQITFGDLRSVAPSIMVFSPRTFQEQSELVETLGGFISPRMRLVIFDTISSLYRLELADRKQTFKLNRQMNRHLASLAELAKGKGIAVLLTSQVRAVFEDKRIHKKQSIEPVAARLLNFWSEIILCLRSTRYPAIKRAELMKVHQSGSVSSYCLLELADSGLQDSPSDL